jgi:hypothetical protein
MEEIGLALPANSFSRNQCFFIRGGNSIILDSDFENIRTHFPNATIETIQMLAMASCRKSVVSRISCFFFFKGIQVI